MLEQGHYRAAAQAFRRATELDPRDPNLLVNTALAEVRNEFYSPDLKQLPKAAQLLETAATMNTQNPRVRYYRALLLRAQGKYSEAAEQLQQLSTEFPRDREVWRWLGQTLVNLERTGPARRAYESVLAVNPTDAGAHQMLASLYSKEGDKDKSDLAHQLYLLWRDDPDGDLVTRRFLHAHPQWVEERSHSHVHEARSPHRPVLTGPLAAPVE